MSRATISILVMVLLCAAGAKAQDQSKPLTETQKIEALIRHVEELKDATFIRNGREHTPADAARHMRDKWQWKKSEIKTADDFVNIAASKSSVSGKPYMIRFRGGKEVKSADYLREQLKNLQKS